MKAEDREDMMDQIRILLDKLEDCMNTLEDEEEQLDDVQLELLREHGIEV